MIATFDAVNRWVEKLWVTVLGMRWDRLFADLEGTADHWARAEVDMLAAELADETWGRTSWLDLIGGHVELDVQGAGLVAGELCGRHDGVLRLGGPSGDLLVASAAVQEVRSSEHRSEPPGRVESALGWPSALRRLRNADEQVRITTVDGRVTSGRIDAVGSDFVRVAVGDGGTGRLRILVLRAVAVVAAC